MISLFGQRHEAARRMTRFAGRHDYRRYCSGHTADRPCAAAARLAGEEQRAAAHAAFRVAIFDMLAPACCMGDRLRSRYAWLRRRAYSHYAAKAPIWAVKAA